MSNYNKEMNFTNIKSFIDYIITFNNIDDILNNCKTQSEKGFIFERLFDIVIKFGFCDIFTNSNFNHLIGNSNNGKLKILAGIIGMKIKINEEYLNIITRNVNLNYGDANRIINDTIRSVFLEKYKYENEEENE